MIDTVLAVYGLNPTTTNVQPFGTGLINNTWQVKTSCRQYILQRINDAIFTNPEAIAHNIRMLSDYLQQHYPGYLFVAPEKTLSGNEMFFAEGMGWFRLFPFVQGSQTINVAATPQQAFEAAKQFGGFTKKLDAFPAASLKTTLPDFHNLTLRHNQFEMALQNGNPFRIAAAINEIAQLKKFSAIVSTFEAIKKDSSFKIRVTHHDTKISNVLFDAADKGLCVIDLDTIMPGYFISDVGDMIRTYVCPVSEEESDCSKIIIRQDFMQAIKEGYMSQMADTLTQNEKEHFLYAGKFMIYMQALRFLTDYLNNDIYYGEKYEGHNLVRAKNQLALLNELCNF